LYLQETDEEIKSDLLESMQRARLRRQQFNYSDSERSADNLHEMIQDMIGGNRPINNNGLLTIRRYEPGYFQNIIQDFYNDNIRPKDSTKGYEGLQKKYVEGATLKTLNKGGVVYANQGMLVPYQPKGTDTVPAMLTPGEFVVNREATKQNLGLLRAINRSGGGRVSYLANGTDPGMGFDFIKPFRELSSVLPNIVSGFRDLLSNLQTPNGVAGGVNNNIGDLSGLSEFTSAFRSFTGELSALASQFPVQINLQLAPASVNVNITGGEVFNTLQPALSEMITMQVNTQLNAWVAENFDGSVENP